MSIDFEKFIKEKSGKITFCTSSSTGAPKSIVKTYENMYIESKDLYEELNLGENLEFITTTTPDYLFGFTFHCMLPSVFGYKRNLNRINYPEEIAIDNSVLITTPSFLEVMRKYNEKPAINPKIIISAGSKLEDDTFKFAQNIAERVIEIYGSTETGIIGYRETPNTKYFKLFKGIKIIDINDERAIISTKYSQENTQILEDKIILEGDKIKFIGRSNRIIKVNEKRINAEELENILKTSEYLDDVCCLEHENKIGVFGALSNIGKDFVLKNGTLPLKKNLKQLCKHNFDVIPQKFKFGNEIFKDKKGKIDRNKIKEIFDLNLSLPLILERKNNSLKLVFLKDSNFFKGHFNTFPIVPGVVQLLYANLFAKLFLDKGVTSGAFRKIKFSNIIRPNEVLYLDLNEKERSIDFMYKNEEKIFSSGCLPKTMLKTLIVLLVFCSVVTGVFADIFDGQTKRAGEFINYIPDFNNINCKFTQTKSFPSGLIVKSGGDFEFKKNDSITFYTKYPIKMVNQFSVKDNSEVNDIINAISTKSYSKLEQEYDFYFENSGSSWILGLVPKTKSKEYDYIKSIKVEGQNTISKILILNKDETKTEIIYY